MQQIRRTSALRGALHQLGPWFGRSRAKQLAREQDGGSLIEFAVCIPPLLMIVTGIYTFGLAISNYIMLVNATDIASRQVAISRNQTTDPCSTVTSTFFKSAPTLTQANLSFTYSFNGSTTSGTSCPSQAANLAQGTTAQVAVSYPCSLIVYGGNYAPNCYLHTQTAALVQ